MEKIKQKNKKLNEERTRKVKKDKSEKKEPAKEVEKEREAREEDSIHPSRRGMVPHRR